MSALNQPAQVAGQAEMPGDRSPAKDGLSAVLVGLLGEARAYVYRDHEVTRLLIEQAAQLLAATPSDENGQKYQLAPWQSARTLAFIDNNLSRTIRVDDLAAVSRLSASYFFRAFRGSFGMPPHSFIMKRRILLAQQLLLKSNESLTEIALTCGLTDQAHFSRIFRRETGQSPGQWRRERLAAREEMPSALPLSAL